MPKVLVTGADGFIGSHLVELLVKQGYSVRAFCLYNSFGNHGWLDTLTTDITDSIEFILGDIRDPQSVNSAVKGCTYVFHLAALIAIPYSYVSPQSYIDTNITGTHNVLQACLAHSVLRLIHTSTSETYGSAQYVPIDEAHPLNAQSPYAATKIAADQLALSFWRSFQLPVTIIRPFNTYGPRQSNRAVIPTIISQIHSGSTELHLGDTTPTRDFNFVTDTANAFLQLSLSDLSVGQVVNSSSSFEISIRQTVAIIAHIMDKDVNIISDPSRLRPSASEVTRLYGDNQLLKSLTSWKPQYAGLDGFTLGLSATIDWFTNSSNVKYYQTHQYSL